jgi:hypothetical protein
MPPVTPDELTAEFQIGFVELDDAPDTLDAIPMLLSGKFKVIATLPAKVDENWSVTGVYDEHTIPINLNGYLMTLYKVESPYWETPIHFLSQTNLIRVKTETELVIHPN